MFFTGGLAQNKRSTISSRYALNIARSVALSAVVVTTAPALAETQIGAAGTVVKDVTGKLDVTIRSIAVRSDVFQDDLIETKDDSATELVFLDGTKISIGPNAKLTLDTFVYNPGDKSGTFKMSLVQGAARFVSGNLSNKKRANYQIDTPTTTIGVRGTKLKIVVDPSGATATELNSLSDVDISNDVGDVVVLERPFDSVTATPSGAFIDMGDMPPWAEAAIKELDALLNPPHLNTEVIERPEIVPPPPPALVQVVVTPPAPEPVEPDGPGLDQAQTVASDTALLGGLVNSAVGVADGSARGAVEHGGGGKSGGGSSGDSSTSSGGGGGNNSASSSGGGTRGKSGTAKTKSRGPRN
ncbi:MAG: hypothetical protein GKS02_11745 [Alphaproteobacteria bacterium]|nr:hypothetical protein [Alphaproteobacteria bacterium]